MELEVLSQLTSAAAQPAGMGYWAGLAVVEPAEVEPLAGSLMALVAGKVPQVGSSAVLVADKEPQVGSSVALVADREPQVGLSVALVADMEQLVGVAFAGRPGAFPGEHSASGFVVLGPVDPGPIGLRLVYRLLRQRVRVIPQSVEPRER